MVRIRLSVAHPLKVFQPRGRFGVIDMDAADSLKDKRMPSVLSDFATVKFASRNRDTRPILIGEPRF